MPTVIEKAIEQSIVKASKSNKPMVIAQVAAHIGIDDETVVEHLQFMQSSGELALDTDAKISLDTSAIEIRKIVAHGSLVTQLRIDEADEEEEPTREETGREEVTDQEGRLIRAVVEAEKAKDENGNPTDGSTGRWLLNIIALKDGELDQELVTDQPFEPDEDGSALSGRDRAWAWWDEYKAEIGPFAKAEPEDPHLDDREDVGEDPKPWPDGPISETLHAGGYEFDLKVVRVNDHDVLDIFAADGDQFKPVVTQSTKPGVYLYNDRNAVIDHAQKLLEMHLEGEDES